MCNGFCALFAKKINYELKYEKTFSQSWEKAIEVPTADILSVVIFYLSLEDRIPFARAIPICGYNS